MRVPKLENGAIKTAVKYNQKCTFWVILTSTLPRSDSPHYSVKRNIIKLNKKGIRRIKRKADASFCLHYLIGMASL